MRALLLAALFLLAPGAPAKRSKPLQQLDRTKAVGAPVLDEKTKEGVYVWLEDGWFNVAAVARSKKRKKQMSVSVRSTKKIAKTEGDFGARAQSNTTLSLSARVGEVPVKGRFKTEGDVTVSSSHALFVGPLSKRAAATVSIGRY